MSRRVVGEANDTADFTRNREYKLSTMSTTKCCHNAGYTVTCSLEVDIRISPAHRTPEAGKSRMQKAQHRDAHILIIRSNNAHPVNFHLIILAVIERYETDSISSFGKLPANERLLHFRTAYVSKLQIIY